ncbi:MAG: hydroxymethylbilane synthase [Gammaproteobacteria bacterium]|nr:hydroxymethylbilane synthase [Gammaproteobacteria bacterium]MDE0441831.1 hydroxymethylbilane synthase [Gammaproteobacteria bacterium]
MPTLRIATRRSPLALTQAKFVAARLLENDPTLEVELLEVATRGDIDQSASLVRSADRDGKPGKGVFIDSLRDAVLDGRADLAAHSMKDVPVAPVQGLALTTFGPRADPRDALVASPGSGIRDLYDLAPGAKVATVSIRRRALLKSVLRDVEVVPVRGNVGTRLERLDEGGYDALLLASAGLDRLGIDGRIAQRLTTETFVPAPGQGALAVEYQATRSDVRDLARRAVDPNTERCVVAEREVARAIGADCALPLGVHCVGKGNLRLTAFAADDDAARVLRVTLSGDDPLALGAEAAGRLDALGARELLGV